MDKKTLIMPFGIPGHNLTQIEREVPADEPPAWPVNAELKEVGKSVKRVDARAKVTGQAKYTSDIQLPGMLYGKMLRSPYPHARIRNIDTRQVERHPGVLAVHILGKDISMAGSKDESADNYPEVKYIGQPIVGVAALNDNTAIEALKLVKIDYEVLPFVVDLEKARMEGAPLVFEAPVEKEASDGGEEIEKGLSLSGNVRGPSRGQPRGDTQKGFAESDIVIERTYVTQVHMHNPLETHGVVVDWKPDGMLIYASTQSTKGVRDEFAQLFGFRKSQVRVITEYMGGGFGAKYGAGNFGVMAGHLSRKSGRPVRLMLDRKEEQLTAGFRPNSVHQLKIGAKKDGKLSAIQQRSYGTAGVGLGAGVGSIAQNMYECPNFATEQYDIFTHFSPGAAWRAPGAVQGAFGLESLIDEIAESLNIDPLKYRDIIDKSEVRKVERQKGAELFGWSKRKKAGSDPGPVKKGMGLAQSSWPRFTHLDSTAEVRLFRDGAVEVRSGVQDLGTGTKTILAQVVAEELGLKTEDITVRIGDTLFPDGPPSGGSVTAGSITPAARNAAYQAKLKLFRQIASKLDTTPDKLMTADGKIYVTGEPSKNISFADALKQMRTEQLTAEASRSDDYGGMSRDDLGSVQFAEVTVDTETGFVKVDRIVAAHSCGRPLNIAQIESQINGGIIHGISYALYESRVIDDQTGQMINVNFDQYKIPYAFEIPDIRTIILEEYPAKSSTDAYGIGEPANIATAVAVTNAIYNAIGVRIFELPVTPAKILDALKRA
ncbi:MAG: xanthine dehydrogenase family protein molybdopterin-binding subunit [Cyclobacteriaceae bacterium]|nr:xanthine dehydrogenase family protein molybdopterin-binding subunit [Cyclobacteriaceae bacterium]